MNERKMLNEIKEIIAEVLEEDISEVIIDGNTKLIGGMGENEIGLTSIDYVQFLVALEEKFNVIFDFGINIDTVSELMEYLNKNMLDGKV